jgi:hypothetical protein
LDHITYRDENGAKKNMAIWGNPIPPFILNTSRKSETWFRRDLHISEGDV